MPGLSVSDVVDAREREDTDIVVSALASTDRNVRRVAARSLRILASPATVPPLIRAARDSVDVEVRVLALKALAAIRDPASADDIYEVASSDTAFGVRATAIDALVDLRDNRAGGLLLALARDLPTRKQTGVFNRHSTIRWMMDRLVRVRPPDAARTIVASMKHLDLIERRYARRALASLADPHVCAATRGE